MNNARPGAGSGTGAKTAGEDVTANLSDPTDIPAPAVLSWLYRRGDDPVVVRRRIAAELDDLLGITRSTGSADLDYHLTGLDLGVLEREAAAPTPIGCAA
ncbi:hypothetical protein [Micromonospora sp. A200]|uniref:hypothetical protein n=1 Tax=Micromonospora sp. A200 TaxID=2940568 RepID=UPI00247316A8|nr:hypothetical protein [Micromonospora sp. A200]